jgi:hypothetical protein
MSKFLKKNTRKTYKKKTQKKLKKIMQKKKTQKKLNKLKKYKRKTQKGGAFTLTICGPDESSITTMANKVNNSTIFKIVHENCVRHFSVTDENTDFQFLYLDNQPDKTGVLVKRYADTDADYIETIATFIRNNQPIHAKRDFLTEHKIIRIMWESRVCETEIDISGTEPKIKELNDLLTVKCGNLSLSLDYGYNMNGYVVSFSGSNRTLLLCLNHPEKGCISSIEVITDGSKLIINSKTKEEFEGKKYNKLLRAATIIIAPLLDCETLTSYAINPISTWLLMNSFNATTTDEGIIEFLHEKGVLESDASTTVTKDMVTWDLIKEYHDEGEVDLEIDLTNPANIQKAQDVFNELIAAGIPEKEIKCD